MSEGFSGVGYVPHPSIADNWLFETGQARAGADLGLAELLADWQDQMMFRQQAMARTGATFGARQAATGLGGSIGAAMGSGADLAAAQQYNALTGINAAGDALAHSRAQRMNVAAQARNRFGLNDTEMRLDRQRDWQEEADAYAYATGTMTPQYAVMGRP